MASSSGSSANPAERAPASALSRSWPSGPPDSPVSRSRCSPDTAGQAVAGVATGIGFLGVGIIWRAEEGQTRGLTTAASILSVAAIGVVTGIGLYLTAILGTALALAILEFDRLPGLHGLHRRVTGRPDSDDEDQS
ncbi:MAG: MgtC/SapB family protein [Actinobacteria bacterium]|nr:MgtC/SapB family protein [Actinomycetota bacterium]